MLFSERSPTLKLAVQQLSRLLKGGRRERRYRHHLFHKKCLVLLSRLQKKLPKPIRVTPRAVQESIVSAGQAVVAEMNTRRIDTVALCVGLLGILASVSKECATREEKDAMAFKRDSELQE